MEQYCAYENVGSGKNVFPYLINLQYPVANVLKHILVAPVIEQSQLPDAQPPSKICPVINIAGQSYVVMTHMMVGLPQKELGKRIADLTADKAALRDAIDFLINGY